MKCTNMVFAPELPVRTFHALQTGLTSKTKKTHGHVQALSGRTYMFNLNKHQNMSRHGLGQLRFTTSKNTRTCSGFV